MREPHQDFIAPSEQARHFAERAALACSVITIVIGLVTFAGWFIGGSDFRSWAPDLATLPPSCALALAALGLALLLLRNEERSCGPRLFVARTMALGAAVLGAGSLLERLFSRDFGIDDVILPFEQMSKLTSLTFLSLGMTILLLDFTTRGARRPAQFVFALTLLAPFQALVAYCYGVGDAILVPAAGFQLTKLSLPAAMAFVCLSLGFLMARPNAGFLKIVMSDSRAGRLARILFSARLLIPPVVGWLVMSSARAVGMPPVTGFSLLVFILSIISFCFIFAIVGDYFRLESNQQRAQNELRVANESLERRVAERTAELDRAVRDQKRTTAFLDSVIENIPNMIFLKDTEALRFVRLNRAGEELLGFSREELLGKSDYDFFPKDQADCFTTRDRQVLESGEVLDISEEPVLTRYQGVRTLHTKKLGVTTADGGRYLLGIAEDITERRIMEDALVKSEARFRTIFENAPVMMVASQAGGKFRLMNKTWQEQTGYSPAEFEGLEDQVGTLVVDADRLNLRNDRSQFKDGKFREYRIRKKNGEVAYHLWATFELPGQDEISLGIDITARKRAEQELVEAREKALEASQTKSAFLATVSHEIRTPINGVIGMADLLGDTRLEGEQKDYVDSIRRSADSLLAIINDILDISKVEAGGLELENVEFDPSDLLEDLFTTFTYAARGKGIDLALEIEDPIPARLIGDPGRLNQILTNLVGNAVKFTLEGKVSISVKQITRAQDGVPDDAILRFEIRDTGIGIQASSKPIIFEEFRQADSSTARRFGGTGLGLSIAKRFVEMMNGQIGFESEEGRGSMFWFSVPFARARAEERVSAPVLSAERKLHILVAEDNPVNQKITLRSLEKLGHTAVAVENGREALTVWRESAVDLIFMDVQMPEMDGYEATRRIRASEGPEHVPIIAMTANVMEGDAKRCFDAGMDDYLSKPVTLDRLLAAVRKWSGTRCANGDTRDDAKGETSDEVRFASSSRTNDCEANA